MSNWIIIAAGGDGLRMVHTSNKIFLSLAGKPVIFHTLETLEKTKLIDHILITVQPKNFVPLKKIVKKAGFNKIRQLIPANHSRQQSTWRALQWLKEKAKEKDLVGVHNAVNPLVTKKEIKAVYKAAQKWSAALLAMPAKDTVKVAFKNKLLVKTTPFRKILWYAQTPQVGRFDILYQAFAKAALKKDWGTDDTMLMEKVGAKVKIVPCSAENFKITYPADLYAAEQIIKLRKEK